MSVDGGARDAEDIGDLLKSAEAVQPRDLQRVAAAQQEFAERAAVRDSVLGTRLFLSSFRLSNTAYELTELVGAATTVAVVLNALDNIRGFARAEWMEGERRALAALGLSARELDLRSYDERPEGLRSALDGVGLVWATGGNVFVLREAMRRSGLDALLTERLGEDTLAYGGYSAGACMAAPTLRGIELVDDASAVRKPIWDGLGFVDFSIAPHYRSAHPDAEPMERVVAHFEEHAMPYRPLRDGQAIVVDGDTTRLVGAAA